MYQDMKLTFRLEDKKSYHQQIKEKVDHLKSSLSFDDKKHFEINLILDEICTNIFMHNNTTNKLEISITIERKNGSLHISIVDNGIPFNVTSSSAPNTRLPLEERQPGGLGLFFVKKYSRRKCETEFRLRKKNPKQKVKENTRRIEMCAFSIFRNPLFCFLSFLYQCKTKKN